MRALDIELAAIEDHVIAARVLAIGIRRDQVRQVIARADHFSIAGVYHVGSVDDVAVKFLRVQSGRAEPQGVRHDG